MSVTDSQKGKLLLLPNVLDIEASDLTFLPPVVQQHVQEIHGVIAESEKGARYFLRRFSFSKERTFRDIPIRLLNEHTQENELTDLLNPLLKGECWGLVSDCGLPCLADPGAKLVFKARAKHIEILAFPGPSSIVLALMLSGFSAQSFAFNGYLDREPAKLAVQIKQLQKRALEEKSTQVFIETPYRNQKLLESLLENLAAHMLLCVAWDLTLTSEQVICLSIAEWKKRPFPSFHKKPAVFLISSP